MRILVDEMPKKTEECIFGQNGPMFRGHRYCELSGGKHYCCDPSECPYLKALATEVTYDCYVGWDLDPGIVEKATEHAVRRALEEWKKKNASE